jgi:hypothetical protein
LACPKTCAQPTTKRQQASRISDLLVSDIDFPSGITRQVADECAFSP